jgi:hypothetical protein
MSIIYRIYRYGSSGTVSFCLIKLGSRIRIQVNLEMMVIGLTLLDSGPQQMSLSAPPRAIMTSFPHISDFMTSNMGPQRRTRQSSI